ncbi:MAG TPA: preprotein translocase subunit SecE [Solirubrobacteraceae bacterium]|nr:preprotein translocase subunit SecE [Solirubrobacteraceae bacterium]
MARDRERARERKARRKGLERNNTPGPVDHASGEVDRFQADLVSQAGGEAGAGEAEVRGTDEAALEREALASAGGSSGGPATADVGTGDASRGGVGRFPGFVRACWAELQRVQWPNRRQVAQGTAVVLGFVALAGAFLGAVDFAAGEVVDLIIL